eukprot:TRINITY_DN17387_c0_g1_i1.p1 TRINITY_DN17387_c0_g1~~TRINITY_DN17387_c0_g1_i1.p1  ORF type:complete len:322 (+),score=68.18 TRINITY_DN17387_c0_g1_i1:89-1054(+)
MREANYFMLLCFCFAMFLSKSFSEDKFFGDAHQLKTSRGLSLNLHNVKRRNSFSGKDASVPSLESPRSPRNCSLFFSQKYDKKAPTNPSKELESLGATPAELSSPFAVRSFKRVQEAETQGSPAIRFVQYNVLADIYANQERYYYCSERTLDWDFRKWKLLLEILEYQPDVLCLQELDHFDFFDEELQQRGYKGIFQRRPSIKSDGVGIFYKTSRIEMLDIQSIDMNKLRADDLGVSLGKALQDRYEKNNVGLLVLFEVKEPASNAVKPKTTFAVATTHTYWNPHLSDLKLRQSHMLLAEMQHFFAEKVGGRTQHAHRYLR